MNFCLDCIKGSTDVKEITAEEFYTLAPVSSIYTLCIKQKMFRVIQYSRSINGRDGYEQPGNLDISTDCPEVRLWDAIMNNCDNILYCGKIFKRNASNEEKYSPFCLQPSFGKAMIVTRSEKKAMTFIREMSKFLTKGNEFVVTICVKN